MNKITIPNVPPVDNGSIIALRGAVAIKTEDNRFIMMTPGLASKIAKEIPRFVDLAGSLNADGDEFAEDDEFLLEDTPILVPDWPQPVNE